MVVQLSHQLSQSIRSFSPLSKLLSIKSIYRTNVLITNNNHCFNNHSLYNVAKFNIRTRNFFTSINYFDADESLIFVLSSGEVDRNISESTNKKEPFIYSPALFVQKNEIKTCSKSVSDIAATVEAHYTIEGRDQFVGGMGENDGGVWFVADTNSDHDTLDYWEKIHDIIDIVKTNRHGIPFGVYTSGIITNKDITSNLKENVGISSIQVTLGSGDPQSYNQVVGTKNGMDANTAFSEVCQFIAQVSESDFPVIAAVAGGRHAATGSELAKALGAVEVTVYDSIPKI